MANIAEQEIPRAPPQGRLRGAVRGGPCSQRAPRGLQAVAAALRLWATSLVRPNCLASTGDGHRSDALDGFSLLYLSRDTLKHPTLRRILFLGFCVLPLFAVLVEQLLRRSCGPAAADADPAQPPTTHSTAAKLAGMLRIRRHPRRRLLQRGRRYRGMIADILVNEAIHQYFSFFMKDVSVHSRR